MLFIFDENYSPKIAQALKILESGNLKSPISVNVEHITNLIERGAPDDEVIKIAGQKKGIIFSKDKDFKTIKALKNVFKEHKAGVALFKL